MVDHARQLDRALLARGDLGLQVGDVLVRVARRESGIVQVFAQRLLLETVIRNQQEVVEEHALVIDGAARWRHGPGRNAADVRMMRAAGGHEQNVDAA